MMADLQWRWEVDSAVFYILVSTPFLSASSKNRGISLLSILDKLRLDDELVDVKCGNLGVCQPEGGVYGDDSHEE